MTELIVLPIAKGEYFTALDWYTGKSNSAARRFASKIDSIFERIYASPDLFPHWDSTYRFGLVEKFPYYVAYRTTPAAIVIVAIRHTSQDQEAWQGR